MNRVMEVATFHAKIKYGFPLSISHSEQFINLHFKIFQITKPPIMVFF